MPEPLTESEILSIIEGDAPPERMARFADALRTDPALLARVQRMAHDRTLLHRLSDEIPAPDGIVAAALDRAAFSAARQKRVASRRASMVAAACLGLALLGSIFTIVFRTTNPAYRTASTPLPASPRLAETDEPSPDAPSGPAGPDADDSSGPTLTTTAQDISNELHSLAQADAPDPILDAFLANIDAHHAATDDELALSSHEIAEAFRRGGLAVRVVGPADSTIAQANGAHDPTTDRAAHAIPEAVIASVPADATDDEIVAALSAAAEPLRARSGVTVTFVELPHAQSAPKPAAHSTDPDSVVWWTNPAGQARDQREQQVPVIVTPEPPATPAAPSPPTSG